MTTELWGDRGLLGLRVRRRGVDRVDLELLRSAEPGVVEPALVAPDTPLSTGDLATLGQQLVALARGELQQLRYSPPGDGLSLSVERDSAGLRVELWLDALRSGRLTRLRAAPGLQQVGLRFVVRGDALEAFGRSLVPIPKIGMGTARFPGPR